jgi:predicted transposase/invertase (TIGR01784 family)
MERLNPKTDLAPIKTLEVLNSDFEPDFPSDKPIALDVRACLENLVCIDIEMQAQVVTTTASRFLYYWARDFGQGLKRGDKYERITPVTQVIWLGEKFVESQQFHSIFHVSEDTTRECFCRDLEIHTLELTKLHLLAPESNPKLYRWSRFLVASSDEEFETLAKEDPDMAHAKEQLDEISSDPEIRARAYERETALRSHYHTLISEREESEARGRVEGRLEERREMLTRLLSKRFGALPDWASERLAHADGPQLDGYVEALLSASTLEEALQQNA